MYIKHILRRKCIFVLFKMYITGKIMLVNTVWMVDCKSVQVCDASDKQCGVPKGIRTPVAAVKGRCPRPLDDGD